MSNTAVEAGPPAELVKVVRRVVDGLEETGRTLLSNHYVYIKPLLAALESHKQATDWFTQEVRAAAKQLETPSLYVGRQRLEEALQRLQTGW